MHICYFKTKKKKKKKTKLPDQIEEGRGLQEIHLLKGEINREHLALMNTWRGDCATGEENVVEQMISQLTRGEGNGTPLQYSCLEKSHGRRSLVGCSPWGR